jgi:hypothetical protein
MLSETSADFPDTPQQPTIVAIARSVRIAGSNFVVFIFVL